MGSACASCCSGGCFGSEKKAQEEKQVILNSDGSYTSVMIEEVPVKAAQPIMQPLHIKNQSELSTKTKTNEKKIYDVVDCIEEDDENSNLEANQDFEESELHSQTSNTNIVMVKSGSNLNFKVQKSEGNADEVLSSEFSYLE